METHEINILEKIETRIIIAPQQERVEITQQDLSRSLALVLVAAFFLFLGGYTLGKYHVVREETQLLPHELYAMLGQPRVSAGKKEGTSQGVYGRFATIAEADVLCYQLKKRGMDVQVHVQQSSTTTGMSYQHYVVCGTAPTSSE
jgi:hypothetical protein